MLVAVVDLELVWLLGKLEAQGLLVAQYWLVFDWLSPGYLLKELEGCSPTQAFPVWLALPVLCLC